MSPVQVPKFLNCRFNSETLSSIWFYSLEISFSRIDFAIWPDFGTALTQKSTEFDLGYHATNVSVSQVFKKFSSSKKMFLHHGGLNDTRRENGVLLNPLQEMIEIEGSVLLTFVFVYTVS